MRKKLIVLFSIAFVLRLLLINVAFHGDLYNNLSWGNMALKGLKGFYERAGFSYSIPNQPPLYILLFAFTSLLFKNINNLIFYANSHIGIFPSSLVWFWQQNGNIILLKLPGIFADLGIGYLIYKKAGFKLASLWLFNPITFYNSAIWGQTDPIVNFLGLIAVYFLIEKKLTKSLFFLTLSLLFKSSLAIFIPILLFWTIWQKYDIQTWIKAIIISSLAVIGVSFIFHPSLDLPVWLFNLYTQRFLPGEIGDLSANAFNLWYLVNPGRVLDSVKYLGIMAHTIGYVVTLLSTVLILLKLRRDKTKKTLSFALALMAITTFLFMTRIHERYLYPFFPVATILVGFIPELLIPYIILSFTFLLNMYNLFWAPGIPFVENILKTTQLPSILAILNLLIFGVLLVVYLSSPVRLKSKRL